MMSVEIIFSYRSWEINPIAGQVVAYGSVKKLNVENEYLLKWSLIWGGRLREDPFIGIWLGNFW